MSDAKMTKHLIWLCLFLLWLHPTLQDGRIDIPRQRYSRYLLQSTDGKSTVVVTGGPEDGASLNYSRFLVLFEARSSTNVRLMCRLDVDGRVYRDWETCISPYSVMLHDDGEYTFQVMADQGLEMGNPVVERHWTLDRVPPDTTIQGPFPDNYTTNPQLHFVSHDARSPISHHECKLDDQEWDLCTSPYPTSELQARTHLFQVRAVDAAGNIEPYPARYLWEIKPSDGHRTAMTGNLPEPESASASSERQVPSDDTSHEPDSSSGRNLISRTKSNWLMSLLILVFALIGVFFLSFGLYKCCQRMKEQSERDRDGAGSQLTSLESEVLSGGIDMSEFTTIMAASWPDYVRRFRYDELVAATGGFPDSAVLGEGGFGKVYAGKLDDGQLVAVKKLEHSGQQGDKEFFVEVAALCRARHLNILRLIGVCIEFNNRVCVFELMDGGSARSLLDEGDPRFNWETRLRVAIGAARGLACLHESVDPPIVHRDLKSENILMDRNGESRISDFGLCTLSHHEARQRHLRRNITMTVGTICGTFGYLAPEVISSGRVSTKSDVYAFGVFLLELLTGRRPIETSRPSREQDLVKWTLRHADERMDRIIEAVDPLISCDVSFVQIMAYVELAASCLHYSPSNRPSASEASRRLEEILSFREQPAYPSKHKKGKMDELLAPRLSDTSVTIPTGMPMLCPSEGELTPHAVTTPVASTSSGRVTEIELLPRRFQDDTSEQPSPPGILSPTHRDRAQAPGPSAALDSTP